MIPYDDLVIALQSWRAKHGLPVAQMSQMSGALVLPSMQGQAPIAAPRSMPPAAPGSGRTAPPPLAHDDALDVDGALIEEANYETEGDFAMAFTGSIEESSTPSSPEHESGTEVGAPADQIPGHPRRSEDW